MTAADDQSPDGREVPEESGRSSFAERLEHLYNVVRPPRREGRGRGGRYSNPQVSEALKDRYGVEVAQASLAAYRSGQVLDPSDEVREALCLFFNVPVSYLSRRGIATGAGAEETPEAIAARALVRDPRVLRASQRLFDLDRPNFDFVEKMLEEVHNLQQQQNAAAGSAQPTAPEIDGDQGDLGANRPHHHESHGPETAN